MACLSFDYAKLTAHPRFRALRELLGNDEGRALNAVCRFWNIAQEYWGKGRRPVPTKVFDLDRDFGPLIDTDFAEKTMDGVLANGAGAFFDWYAEKREAARKGGLASVAARRLRSGSAVPLGAKNTEALTERRSNVVRTSSEAPTEAAEAPTEPTPNPSTSTSTSNLNTNHSPASPDEVSSPSRKKPKVERQTTWEPNDPFAKIFEHLKVVGPYWAVFDREHDRKTIQGHMDRERLNASEMESVVWQFRNWADGSSTKIKSPRGTLSTFVQRFVERRKQQEPARQPGAITRKIDPEKLDEIYR